MSDGPKSFRKLLSELFPNKSQAEIVDAIVNIDENEDADNNFEIKLDVMIDCLGAGGSDEDDDDRNQEDFEEEGAVGFDGATSSQQSKLSDSFFEPLPYVPPPGLRIRRKPSRKFEQFEQMLPNTNPDLDQDEPGLFLTDLLNFFKEPSLSELSEFVQEDFDEEGAVGFDGATSSQQAKLVDYYARPKFHSEFYNQPSDLRMRSKSSRIFEQLEQMLPNADPEYLEKQAYLFEERPSSELGEFIQEAIEKNEYPTKQNYLKRKKILEEISLYTDKFTIEQFLDICPNPTVFYAPPDYKSTLMGENVDENDVEYALNFLYNHFNYIRMKDIKAIFDNYKKHLVCAYNRLRKLPKAFRSPRAPIKNDYAGKNIDLMQEIAYLRHKQAINNFVKRKNVEYSSACKQAEMYNLLERCGCCFEEGLIPEECYFCNKNCIFCKDCVKRGAEVVIGTGGLVFPCIGDCDSHFELSTLKMVLERKIFQALLQRIQIDDVRQANIVGLETCPFCCNFFMIPIDGDLTFKCRDIDCMKESCRACHHESHIPYKCNEIESDEDVKMRTYIENKMSEAFLRECPKCSRKFYKESGCNKMTCECGMKICYVCGMANVEYGHFGKDVGRCPLFTHNLVEFHTERVLQGAKSTKEELGVHANPDKLKFDPAKDIIL